VKRHLQKWLALILIALPVAAQGMTADVATSVPRFTVVPVLIDKDVRVGGAGVQLETRTVRTQVAQDVIVNGMLIIKAGDIVEGHLSTEKNPTRRVFSADMSQEADLDIDDVITYCGDTIHLYFERTLVGGLRAGFLDYWLLGAHAHDAVFDKGIILRAVTDRLEKSVCAQPAKGPSPALPLDMVVSNDAIETAAARANRLADEQVAEAASGRTGPREQTFDLPLPDPLLTPGDIADRDIKDICFPGYADHQGYLIPANVAKTFDRYQIPGPLQLHRFVVDRLVPASLGGSGELDNLWAVPLEAVRRKRFIEESLQEAVCSGQISLAEAQRRMITDWRSAVTW